LRSATSRSRSEKEKGSSSKKEEEAERRAEATMLDARCLLLSGGGSASVPVLVRIMSLR